MDYLVVLLQQLQNSSNIFSPCSLKSQSFAMENDAKEFQPNILSCTLDFKDENEGDVEKNMSKATTQYMNELKLEASRLQFK